MKSEEQHLPQTENILSDQIDKITFDHQNLHCLKGNTATFLCQNKNCAHASMICSAKECECQKIHKKCLKTFSQEFFVQINKKIQPTAPIKQRVDTIIDEAIDFISNLRDEIYLNLKYLGLNQDEKDLMELLNHKEYQEISGSRVWKICQKIYEQKQISSSYIIKQINAYWAEYEGIFKKSFGKIRQLSEKEGKSKNIFSDSDVITKDEDSQNLVRFLTEEVISVKQLYSASKSKYQMKVYHQACAGKKNLLVVVKGMNGKIFGGFWPNELPKLNSHHNFGGNAHEISSKSFIFSLTNKDKFKMVSQMNPIQNHDPRQGPNFGNDSIGIYGRIPHMYRRPNENNPVGNLGGFGGFTGTFNAFGANQMQANNFNPGAGFAFGVPPMAVVNNAEMSEHYCAVLQGKFYMNENYEPSNPESRMKFAGTEEVCFAIKQWEVYQIKFQESEEK